jgi:hypothetical protein
VQPFLASILEELMGPVSSGFSEVRALFEREVGELGQSVLTAGDRVQLKEVGTSAFICLPPSLPPCLPSFLPCILSSVLASIHPTHQLMNPSIHLIFFFWGYQDLNLEPCA